MNVLNKVRRDYIECLVFGHFFVALQQFISIHKHLVVFPSSISRFYKYLLDVIQVSPAKSTLKLKDNVRFQ